MNKQNSIKNEHRETVETSPTANFRPKYKIEESKFVFTNTSQKPEPDLHIISFDEYFDYVHIRKKRIKIFLLIFFSVLLTIGLATFLTIYGTMPCLFNKCNKNAFCINTPFVAQCHCAFGYSGDGKKECDECGLSFYDMSFSAIENQTDFISHAWPFYVFIYKQITIMKSNKNQLNETNNHANRISPLSHEFCSGSLINKRTILTSASCFYHDPLNVSSCNTSINYKITYWAFLGYDNIDLIKNIIENKHKLLSLIGIKVDKIILHELYSPETGKNDVALIKLDEAALLSDTIQTICLPKENSTVYPESETTAFAINLDFENPKLVLSSEEITIYNNSLCTFNQSKSNVQSLNKKNKFKNHSLSNPNQTVTISFDKLVKDSISKYNDVLYFFENQFYKNASFIDFNLNEANFTKLYTSNNSSNFTLIETLDNSNICADEICQAGECKDKIGTPLVSIETIQNKQKYVISGLVSDYRKNLNDNKLLRNYTRIDYYLEWIFKNSRY